MLKRAIVGDRDINTPSVVATPLPPLNLRNIGNICPRTAAKATNPKPNPVMPTNLATNTGNNPFKISPSKTKIAAFLPPERSTFVVPGFLEPIVLGSGKFSNLLTITALDMEPQR